MDRIAELSPHGLRLYGGNYALYAGRRDAEAEAARRELAEASKAVKKSRREAQAARERQERRNSRGRKDVAKAGLRLILGELRPEAAVVRLGVERAHCLDQRAAVLWPGRSVLENFRACNTDLSETVCRLTLARFLFRTDAVHRPAGALSGGERLRAALACVLTGVAPPQLLILDEPTNHLDLASLANLEQALRLYTGALLVVSHDRTFLDAVGATRRAELARR
jgi:ATPase subunit of ABC transporter with duplicated ATPase domains